MTFRELYRRDLPVRTVDLALHILAALLLPGPWWFQWLPDVLVVPLWINGIWTNRLLPHGSMIVRMHGFLHWLWIPGVLLVLSPPFGYYAECLCAHWAAHCLIDLCTHLDWKRETA